MLNISEAVLGQRLTNSKQCAYLYNIYDNKINSIVCNEYGLICPSLVSQLISQFAHSNDDLQTIFKNKLFYKYYIHLYGINSFYRKKFAVLHTISTLSNILIFTISSFKYLLNINNFQITSMSVIISSAIWIFHNTITKTTHTNHNFNANHDHAAHHSYAFPQKKQNKLQNIAPYYIQYFDMKNAICLETAMDSAIVNGLHFIEYIVSAITADWASQRFKSSYLSKVFGQFLFSNILELSVLFPSTEYITLPTKYPNEKVTPPSITALLFEPRAGRSVKLMFQLWVSGFSSYRWYMALVAPEKRLSPVFNRKYVVRNNKRNYKHGCVKKLYFMQRMFTIYPAMSNIIDYFVPSYTIHFNKLPLVNVSKIIAVSLHFIASFASLGLVTYEENKKEKPRDIFEWTYHLVKRVPVL
eukprot:497317_1